MNSAAKQSVHDPGEAMAFVDLAAQYRRLEPRIRARIDRVLAHGRFIHGPEIQELEEALANHAGVRHAVSCASGTDALLMALMAHEVGPGDAVFTTPFTFIATAEPIALLGATPVFADIDPRTFNLDPVALETMVQRTVQAGKLTPRGVIAVDLFGLPADYDAIEAVTRHHGLFLIEDAAQSFGASYHGRRAGSLAALAAFSFFPAKPLGCYGDGGALLTDDDELAARARSVRVHGQGDDKYDNVRIGLNARLDTLQAAILLAKLESFPAEQAARQGVAQRYTRGLQGLVQTPYVPQGYTSAWAQYSVVSERRAEIQEALRAHGIPSAVYYRKALHLQPAFASLGLGEGAFPVAEATARRILSLPMHPYLEPPQQDRVVAAIESVLRS
jgi:UDP-2-acetamido-2-deoxy-ribo-hexuluronate aminotransferase